MFKKLFAISVVFMLLLFVAEPVFAKGGTKAFSSTTRNYFSPTNPINKGTSIYKSSSKSSSTKSGDSSNGESSTSKSSTSPSTSSSSTTQPKTTVKPGSILSSVDRENATSISGATYNGFSVFLTAAGTYFILSQMGDKEEAVAINEEQLEFNDTPEFSLDSNSGVEFETSNSQIQTDMMPRPVFEDTVNSVYHVRNIIVSVFSGVTFVVLLWMMVSFFRR